MGFRVSWLVAIGAVAISIAPLAFAQDVGNAAATATAPAPSSTGGGSTDGVTTTVPAPTTSAAPAATAGPTMGYAYSDGGHRSKDAATATPHPHARARVHHSGPVATLPGFLLLPEGGSRLFVELTANVAVEEKPIAGGITYVLKGAHVVKRNNENALITVHFNTPVTRARLIPSGGDLHFVVDLRQNVKATWKLVPAKDGATVLQIDFPGGNYLPNDVDSSPSAGQPKPAPKTDAAKK